MCQGKPFEVCTRRIGLLSTPRPRLLHKSVINPVPRFLKLQHNINTATTARRAALSSSAANDSTPPLSPKSLNPEDVSSSWVGSVLTSSGIPKLSTSTAYSSETSLDGFPAAALICLLISRASSLVLMRVSFSKNVAFPNAAEAPFDQYLYLYLSFSMKYSTFTALRPSWRWASLASIPEKITATAKSITLTFVAKTFWRPSNTCGSLMNMSACFTVNTAEPRNTAEFRTSCWIKASTSGPRTSVLFTSGSGQMEWLDCRYSG
mmetsp:Transcript_72421/g.235236  ORF Transcript_72421/g.235236 Transcript_72421/m.235236 type:complete len:263 (-) Transcript_72421:868-1656(-)